MAVLDLSFTFIKESVLREIWSMAMGFGTKATSKIKLSLPSDVYKRVAESSTVIRGYVHEGY